MSGAFEVDVDELTRVVGELQACERGLREVQAELRSRMEALHHVWSGEAAAAQEVAMDEWVSGFEGMRTALDDMRAVADVAQRNYRAAVEANVGMWARVR